ncbi:hypothetical protein AFLA_013784 [Aspergillus flavus NRRL3357]|nr:hypothetical protein AFLA_013784 [Aspergillus flavus NRRL3357]
MKSSQNTIKTPLLISIISLPSSRKIIKENEGGNKLKKWPYLHNNHSGTSLLCPGSSPAEGVSVPMHPYSHVGSVDWRVRRSPLAGIFPCLV